MGLSVAVLGTFEAAVDGALLVVDTKKALALLAVLAAGSGPQSRDVLTEMLWPDQPPERSRSSFRRTLSTLRSALGNRFIEADRAKVVLAADDEVEVDLWRFRRLLASCQSHDHPSADVCTRCGPPLSEAANLFRGEFLTGFSIRDAPEFEHWVRTLADSIRGEVSGVLDRLARLRAGEGDYPTAIQRVRRRLELEPLHEPSHRYLMLLHAWSGDRAGALDRYRECVAVLERELGVSPLEETTELAQAILEDDLPRAPAPIRTTAISITPTHSKMVGRAAEFALIRSAWDSAGGAGRLVCVTGEPGIGKTRLLEEVTGSLPDRVGILVRAYRAEQDIPYGVVAQLVEAALGAPVAFAGLFPQWVLSELARLVPDVRQLDLSIPEPSDLEGPGGQARFLAALEQALAVRGRPGAAAMIAVDDAHRCDPASAAFLAYLARRITRHRILLVLGYRAEELEAGSPLAAAFNQPDLPIERVDLDRLGVAEVSALIAGSAHPELSPEDVLVWTGGLPLLVEEQIQRGTADLSEKARRGMNARLTELSALSQQVAAAMAVLGGPADSRVLQTVSGRTEEELVTALEELTRKYILRELPAGGIEFLSEPLRELAYGGATLVRRRLLHRRAAEILAGAVGPEDARRAASVARHFQLAGLDTAAAQHAGRAGELARIVFAYAEAAEHYRTALALGHPDPTSLHLGLGEIALISGEFGTALVEFQAAAATASGATAALADHRLGEVQRRLGRFVAAEEQFRRAESNHPEPSALYADWAQLARRTGDHKRAHSLAEQAVSHARQTEGDQALARALQILGVLSDQSEEANRYLQESLVLSVGLPEVRMAVLNSLGFLAERRGDLPQAVALTTESLELAEAVGDRHRQAALHNRLADLYHAQGDEERSQVELTRAVGLFSEVEATVGHWEPEVWFLSQW
jgi:DNA-binding SARP family transcriptional activator/predicted ATPase